MNKFVFLELKKIGNRNTLIIAVLFLAVVLLPLFHYAQIDVLDNKGNVHSGIGGWTILKDRTLPLEGVVTPNYIFRMRNAYQSSVDKDFIEGKVDTEKKLGVRLTYPEDTLDWLLNFPYHSEMSTAHDDLNLTDEQITNFYANWKNGFSAYLSDSTNGFSYTMKQIKQVSDRAQKVQTPFVFKYSMGWQFLKVDLSNTLYLFFIFLSLLLVNFLSRDSTKGIDQLVLAARESRGKLIGYKIRAACLFSTAAYVIYIGVLLIFVSCVYSLHGWDAPVQFGAITFYSLDMLQESIIYVIIGYLATIAITHFILFLSLLLKRGIPALAILVICFYLIEAYKMSSMPVIKSVSLFMPQNFVNGLLDVDKLFFFGDVMLPYAVVALVLAVMYIIVFRLAMAVMMKRYYLQ